MKKSIRDSFGESLVEIGKQNEKIVAVSCDLKNACRLNLFFEQFPERSIECGIAEANAIGISSGLALSGFRPFLASFGSFITGKNIEIRTSVSYNLASVVIVGTHGGLIGPDGATQAALQDIAVMRTIPDFEIFQPCSNNDVKSIMNYLKDSKKPTYLRIGRNEIDEFLPEEHKFQIGKANLIIKGKEKLVISSGPMVRNCYDAIKDNNTSGLLNISSLKPIDENQIIEIIKNYNKVITVEDHLIEGGLGSIISEIASSNGLNIKVFRHGLINEFIESDTPSNLEKKYKLDPIGIREKINNF